MISIALRMCGEFVSNFLESGELVLKSLIIYWAIVLVTRCMVKNNEVANNCNSTYNNH